jgi:hypothetical protein
MLRNPLHRKLAIAIAALAVCVVPTACSSAYAAQTSHTAHSAPTVGDADGDGQPDDAAKDQDSASQDTANQDPAQDQANEQDPADAQGGDQTQDPNADANQDQNQDQAQAQKDAQQEKDQKGKDKKKDAEENNGLDVLGRDCSNSKLEPHDGFQEAPRCVSTAFGEVAAADKSPSLLITKAPDRVKQGEDFTLDVSTRNLVRDRFLGAAVGGYYLESSFLNADGLQRGHFHTACRMLASTDTAPDSSPDPDFFVATQDNKGGAEPDTVTINVPGVDKKGTMQCTSWAGDGSHRIPMMQRANQTPAIDSVRITVE